MQKKIACMSIRDDPVPCSALSGQCRVPGYSNRNILPRSTSCQVPVVILFILSVSMSHNVNVLLRRLWWPIVRGCPRCTGL